MRWAQQFIWKVLNGVPLTSAVCAHGMYLYVVYALFLPRFTYATSFFVNDSSICTSCICCISLIFLFYYNLLEIYVVFLFFLNRLIEVTVCGACSVVIVSGLPYGIIGVIDVM